MATPAMNFVALCANANLPIPSTKARQQALLKDSGTSSSVTLSTAEVKERAASLIWVRHAVANGIPPDTWPSLLAPVLLNDVRGLYPIPPAKSGADPAETDLHRLVQVVSLFMPDVPLTSTPPSAPQAAGGGIDTTRPAGPPAPPAPPVAGLPQSGASAATSPPQPSPLGSAPKRTWLMHDELYAVLPDAVYNALDANANLNASARAKLQDACKKSFSGALFDAATGAPFGHQLQLTLPENAHFDPVKRGLALSIAARSVGVETSGTTALADAAGRRSVLQEFKNNWDAIKYSFSGAYE
jgi:hypothetical protein